MKLDITVKNLGRLKSGTVKIRPLTIITGENGTGKSFFTKTLYSIFSVLNKNVLHIEIINLIKATEHNLDIFLSAVQRKSQSDTKKSSELLHKLHDLKDELDMLKYENIAVYILQLNSLYKSIERTINGFEKHLKKIQKNPIKVKFIKVTIKKLIHSFKELHALLIDGENSYADILSNNLANEIKQNFQIKNLFDLIAHGESKVKLSSELFEIGFDSKNKINFSLKYDFIDEISNLSRIVFFESPAYWKVRDALIDAKNTPSLFASDLTGVPKYFYDLDKTLRTKSKEENTEILKLSNIIKKQTKGEFVFEGGRLSFQDEDGNEINKNLISFGMTNLGMMQLLLKHNVISEGSFVFFDEPETNLHPSWQVLLTEVLIELAKSGVNVVMATHSLDMIKALEVKTKALEVKTKGKDKQLIAVNHFTSNGDLLKFDSEDITENLIESRNELMNAYEDLFLSELHNPEND